MSDTRYEAYKLLMKIEKDQSYSVLSLNEALKSIKFSDSRDTAFVVSLVYGVLERKLTLDYNIALYLSSSLKKLKLNVLTLLRLGAFQILYMDKIPDSAAVNETVKLIKKSGAGYASGMVNAVLRKISSNKLVLPEKQQTIDYLSTAYSVEMDIAESLVADYGFEMSENILSSFFGRRPIYIRCNTLKCSADELILTLENEGISVENTSIADCLRIDHTGDISRLDSFKNGLFYVQDMSSQLCCKIAGVTPGDTVIDCCAAPGGKSFTLAQYLGGKGSLISCDIHQHKKELIEQGALKLGISNLIAVCSDARNLNKSYSDADVVLCDVPCSGFGVMGRKPEIRYKKRSETEGLPEIQKQILDSCSRMVRSGGVLLYSTCTLNKAENEQICESFLAEHNEFMIADDDEYRNYTDRFITVFPKKESGDGFFIAKFTRC